MSLHIHGLATAVPEYVMTQAESMNLSRQVVCTTEKQARLLEVIYRRSGVEQRRTVLPHRIALDWLTEPPASADAPATRPTLGPTTAERMKFFADGAPTLACQSAREAIREAQLEPRDISHLITVTCTGFDAPGFDVDLIQQLRLPPTTQRIQVGFMGCHGTINGLRAAQAIADSQPTARVLLCAVELCSLHYRFLWDTQRIMGNVLFGDGAAALVGGGEAVTAKSWQVVATGSCLLPDSRDAMTWQIGDHGFEMTLSARVPDLITQHLGAWLDRWLDMLGLTRQQIGNWAVHPGGPRIIAAVEEALQLQPHDTAISRAVLAQHGNMSSPTVLFILDEIQRQDLPGPCLMLAFGPGLVAEAALLIRR